MLISKMDHLLTRLFHNVLPRRSQPLGHIDLSVTFDREDNLHVEIVTFGVVDIDLPYNVIIDWPSIAKFIAIPHYAYLAFKMLGPNGVIEVKVERKHAITCVEIILTSEALPKVEVGSKIHPVASWAPATWLRTPTTHIAITD
jgi:hypothetical protein